MAEGGLQAAALGNCTNFGVFAFSAYRIQPSMFAIFKGQASLKYGKEAIESVWRGLNPSENFILLPSNQMKPFGKFEKIELRNATFAYAGRSQPAIKNMNLTILAGKSMGIIGATGSGKTTLIDILLALLVPQTGSLLVNSRTLNCDDDIRSWQSALGYVPQEIYLSDSTISENVAFGLPVEKIDQKRVEECLKIAQLNEFAINELPSGYDTFVGERE